MDHQTKSLHHVFICFNLVFYLILEMLVFNHNRDRAVTFRRSAELVSRSGKALFCQEISKLGGIAVRE